MFRALRRHIETMKTYPNLYAFTAMYASMFAMLVALIVYTNHTATESNRKWCGLVTTLDNAYVSTPPQSEAGRKVAAEIHKLREEFDC